MSLKKFIQILLLLIATHAGAAITVKDDLGYKVTLQRPAQRIVTLAPHTMELVCAAGACSRIVGKGSHSHYPPMARAIPEVGDNRQVDIERVLALKPELMVIWRHGISQRTVEQLKKLGIPLFISDPRRLDDIPDSLGRLGVLLGTQKRAGEEALKLRRRLADLNTRYAGRQRLTVFYQISDRPLYTLNDEHIVGEAIRICGGKNVFGAMKTLAPQISVEAVLQANPDVIVHTSVDEGGGGLAFWKKYPAIKAVKRRQMVSLNPDWLDRPGPRMVDGVAALCTALDNAR